MPSPPATLDQNNASIEWAHDSLNLTWEEVAGVLGTTTRTLQRWRAGAATPGKENLQALDSLQELRFWLDAVFEGDQSRAMAWLNTRILDLRGKSPLHAIKSGNVDRINEFLATFHSGAFL